MLTLNQLKTEFDKRSHRYSEEFTTGNYNDKGEIIDRKISTLTTEFCEIGFDDQIIYFVYIAQSDSWSNEFFYEIKKFSNLKIYGFKKFLNDIDLTKDPGSEIKSEPYFQMQFSFKNDYKLSEAELLGEYDLVTRLLKEHQIEVVDQLEKMMSS